MAKSVLGRVRTVVSSPWTRVAGTVLGIGLLVHAVDFPKAIASFGHADLRLLIGALGLTCLAVLASVAEWGVLIRTTRHSEPTHSSLFTWPRLISQYLQSLFFTQVIPASVGGDAVRTVEMGRHVGHSKVLASLAGSRMAGMAGMAVWGLAAAVLLRDLLGKGVLIAIAALAGVIIIIWCSALSSDRIAPHRLVWRVSKRMGHALHAFTVAFGSYRRHPHAVAQCLLVGTVGWGINLFALAFAARAIGVDLSWTVLAVFIPLGLLSALLPISVNGLGVREGVLVALLVSTGVSATHAGAVSLLVDLQMVPFAVLGAVLWARRRTYVPVPALAPLKN